MLTPLPGAPFISAQLHYDRVHYALLHLEYALGLRAPLYGHVVLIVSLMIAVLLISRRFLVRSTLLRLLLIAAIASSGILCASSTNSWWASSALSMSVTPTTPSAPGSPTPDVADSGVARWAVDMVEEEAIGPFSSWANVKSNYGAAGDGVVDDTSAIQRALNDLGHSGKAQVLYLPAGTYRITATLLLTGSQEFGRSRFGWGGIGIIGADPATTTIKWAGRSDRPMLIQNGGLGYRYNRLTWDGSGIAGIGVAHWWNAKGGVLYGGFFEHKDEVFKNMKIGIMAGRMGANYGQLDSEGQVRRVTFINNTYAGLDMGSFNALDWWVWDSHFINCARGVSNEYSLDEFGVTAGAGAAYVYRSLFEHSSVADMFIRNTGWFSLHNNVSIGSRRFFEAAPMGANAAVVIAQNNRVVQSTDPVPISLGNTGPLLLVDNQVQASRSTYVLTDWVAGRDVLSLGNRVTAPPPAPRGSDRLLSIDDVTVPEASISTQSMPMPSTPVWTAHQVFEVPTQADAGQIQAIIDQSAHSSDSQPIVHFGRGTWTLSQSLRIPKNARIQLVGDGFGSILSWSTGAGAGPMLNIVAPAKVTVRDMQWVGIGTVAIGISAADQSGGRIQIVGSVLGPVVATHLEKTQLSLQANMLIASVSFSDVIHAVAISTGPFGPVTLTDGSNFLMADTWYEGDETALFRMSSATFTYLGGHMAPASHPGASNLSEPAVLLDQFTGVASWIGMEFDLSAIPSGVGIRIDGEKLETRAYFMGTTSYVPNYFQRKSAGAASGTVGFILNRTARGSTDMQAANHGSSTTADIIKAWHHARSLSWDSTPYQVPAGAVDIRIYHMKMDETAGLMFKGQ